MKHIYPAFGELQKRLNFKIYFPTERIWLFSSSNSELMPILTIFSFALDFSFHLRKTSNNLKQ